MMRRLSSFTAKRAKPSRWGVIGVRRTLADDFQFICLDMEWGTLLCFVMAVYFAVSCLFAVGFLIIAVC